ncbi:IclR family transcriptional regulator [Sporosarcina sp. ACRSL]|uniref:IclR family transcriptional regulator n=1 Tax=Sporosarcina sp. ACRSL TaxID=2918215 RepID=UPI001EF71491|nr:IclR family transcriptional regulator [Sporosarcina sp. ACRSL]MCG7344145.1 IclR family transcriptional regulator [Sporosarcina sp. ACRSL]
MSIMNKTVIRTMELLYLFTDHPELTFQEIVELSGMPKSSVYRMLLSLEEMKFLEKKEDTKYRLGTIFLTFGHLVSSRMNIRQIAEPIMRRLHSEVHQAVNLTILEGDEAIYIEKIDELQKVKLYTSVGRRSPLYGGACARAVLSFQSDEFIEEYLERVEFIAYSNNTITDRKQLLASIEDARKIGYTFSKSELENHTASIAAPIYNSEGKAIGSLSVAGIEIEFSDSAVEHLSEKVKAAAKKISEGIGYEK